MSSGEMKEVLDGVTQVAVRAILQKARKGQKLTARDVKVLSDLRQSLGEGDGEEENWDKEYRKFKALLVRLSYDARRGELLPREQVTVAWRNRYSHVKRHLLLWSKRLPGRLVGMDERAMGEAIEEEVHFLLSLLARPGRFTPTEKEKDEGAAGGDQPAAEP